MIAIVTVNSITNEQIDTFPIEVNDFTATVVAEEIMLHNTGLTSDNPKHWDLMLSCMKTPSLETLDKIIFNKGPINYIVKLACI